MEDVCDTLFARLGIVIGPVTVAQAEIGRASYREYGRGTDNKAARDLGDCFAYALAKSTGESLL